MAAAPDNEQEELRQAQEEADEARKGVFTSLEKAEANAHRPAPLRLRRGKDAGDQPSGNANVKTTTPRR